jgi:putative hydrolase of the HAD superfamily
MSRDEQVLLIDGDDTLWEDSVFFQQAIETFFALLERATMSREEIHGVLDEMQLVAINEHGYGARSFAHGLRLCYDALLDRTACEAGLEERVAEVASSLERRPMELLAGVVPTLEYLADRHPLVLVTKGNPDEQRVKIQRSGLAHHFQRVVIVAEKSSETYAGIVRDDGLDPRSVWMIGNSPRSDINPALAAGLNAVFVPHPRTWRLDDEALAACSDQQVLLVVDSFGELRDHF